MLLGAVWAGLERSNRSVTTIPGCLPTIDVSEGHRYFSAATRLTRLARSEANRDGSSQRGVCPAPG